MYAEVLVEYGVKSLDRSFTYHVPKDLKLKVGMKVLVPFGKTVINGFVTNITKTTDVENIKDIISITNENLVLNKELLELGHYIKEKTLCSLITSYNTMFPSSMKVKNIKHNYDLYDSFIDLKDETGANLFIESNKRSKKAMNY